MQAKQRSSQCSSGAYIRRHESSDCSRYGGQNRLARRGLLRRRLPPYIAPGPYIRRCTLYSPRPIPASTSVQNFALLLLPLREMSHPCCRCCEKEHTHAYSTTSTVVDIGTMPCAAGELCLIPDRTPQRPDGYECRGKCGGRLHGFCGEAGPDCGNPMQRVCHDCLAAKNYLALLVSMFGCVKNPLSSEAERCAS